jgi:hypothetical protein
MKKVWVVDDFTADLEEFEEFNGYEFAEMILEPEQPSRRRASSRSEQKDTEKHKEHSNAV